MYFFCTIRMFIPLLKVRYCCYGTIVQLYHCVTGNLLRRMFCIHWRFCKYQNIICSYLSIIFLLHTHFSPYIHIDTKLRYYTLLQIYSHIKSPKKIETILLLRYDAVLFFFILIIIFVINENPWKLLAYYSTSEGTLRMTFLQESYPLSQMYAYVR